MALQRCSLGTVCPTCTGWRFPALRGITCRLRPSAGFLLNTTRRPAWYATIGFGAPNANDSRHLHTTLLRWAARNATGKQSAPWTICIYINKYLTIVVYCVTIVFVILEMCALERAHCPNVVFRFPLQLETYSRRKGSLKGTLCRVPLISNFRRQHAKL